MNDNQWYFAVGGLLGLIPALIAFIGGWWYCASTYGFLLGFGLGWLPSIILAAIIFFAIMLLWGPILLIVAYFLWQEHSHNKKIVAENHMVSQTAVSAPTPPSRPDLFLQLALGSTLEWSPANAPDKTHLSTGSLSVLITKVVEGDQTAPLVQVSDNANKVEMLGEMRPNYQPHRLTAFENVVNGGPSIMLESYSGGAHCCNQVTVAGNFGNGLAVTELGSWDGDNIDFPADVSGDGIADFIASDDSFLYEFAPYAVSRSPPEVINIIDGRPVNVSSSAAFQAIYRKDMEKTGRDCQKNSDGFARNAACAAFVADAARVGEADQAWALMLVSYDPGAIWDWFDKCTIPTVDICPRSAQVHFTNFPEALLNFLKRENYVSADWTVPKAPETLNAVPVPAF